MKVGSENIWLISLLKPGTWQYTYFYMHVKRLSFNAVLERPNPNLSLVKEHTDHYDNVFGGFKKRPQQKLDLAAGIFLSLRDWSFNS